MQSLTSSLDTRRLAMLKAMGVDLWWAKAAKVANGTAPAATAATAAAALRAASGVMAERPASPAAPQAASLASAPAAEASAPAGYAGLEGQRAVAVQPVASPSPVTPMQRAQPASSDWRAPEQAVAAPQAVPSSPSVVWSVPTLWQVQQASDTPVSGASAAPRLLLLVDDLQVLGDAQAAAMQLLENMVRAMGLASSPALWLSWAKRTLPPAASAAAANAAAQPVATAEQLLAQSDADAVLVMGREAAQQWLGRTEPLGALRQDTHSAHGLPVVVTYSPAYLLRATHAKRQAWADLQRLMALLAEAKPG